MKIIKGNILDIFREADEAYLLHGVSCQPVLHAGLAKQIIVEYPNLLGFHRSKIFNSLSKELLLGTCTFYQVHPDKTKFIVNLYQQQNIGRNRQQIDYNAFANALFDFSIFKTPDIPIYISEGIGSGNAGGRKETILEIIERILPEAILVRYVTNL